MKKWVGRRKSEDIIEIAKNMDSLKSN